MAVQFNADKMSHTYRTKCPIKKNDYKSLRKKKKKKKEAPLKQAIQLYPAITNH